MKEGATTAGFGDQYWSIIGDARTEGGVGITYPAATDWIGTSDPPGAPTGNNFINMIKGTSMASVIAFLELVHAANNISSRNLEIMETLFAAAAWYLVMVSLASIGQHYLERAHGPR